MKSIILTIAIIFLFVSCSDFSESPSGLEYKIISAGNETRPDNGQYLIMEVMVKTAADSIIYDSKILGFPLHYRYDEYTMKLRGTSQFEEGILMLTKGDSGVFRIDTNELYFMKLTFDNPNNKIICNVKLKDILNYSDYTLWKAEILGKKRSISQKERSLRFEIENNIIDSLLNAQNIEHLVAENGMRFHIDVDGNGDAPVVGDSVAFTYEVIYLDGTILPHELGSSGNEPKSFVLGSPGVFESWQESIKLLKAGGAGTFYFPSTMAFGNTDAYGIKPNAILRAKINLIRIY